MTKNKYIDDYSKDESNPLHYETYSLANAEDIKVFDPRFKYLTPEKKIKNQKRLKNI